MTKKGKLLLRFLSLPADFHFHEAIQLLKYFGYSVVKTGKTSGSRVRFINHDGRVLILHKPHPGGILKHYQMKQLKEFLTHETPEI